MTNEEAAAALRRASLAALTPPLKERPPAGPPQTEDRLERIRRARESRVPEPTEREESLREALRPPPPPAAPGSLAARVADIEAAVRELALESPLAFAERVTRLEQGIREALLKLETILARLHAVDGGGM